MSWLDVLALFGAGAVAGLINTVVGSGTLVTFPTLLALGVPPVMANVSNSVGLAPGSLSGAWSMRPELAGQRARVIRLGTASLIGGTLGAVLLLRLPSTAFDAIVPVLIGVGCVLVIIQPRVSRLVAARRERLGSGEGPPHESALLWIGVLATGVYGGYFGAAQGVIVMALMGIGLVESMVRLNALKNVLVFIVNGVAAVIFIIFSEVNWWAAGALALGAVIGAQIGGRIGRKLPPIVYRVLIVVVGVVAIIKLLSN